MGEGLTGLLCAELMVVVVMMTMNYLVQQG